MTTHHDKVASLQAVETTGSSRSWRSRGIAVSVFLARDAGIDGDFPWVASCDTHGQMITCATKRAAESAARDRDWCSGCQQHVAGGNN